MSQTTATAAVATSPLSPYGRTVDRKREEHRLWFIDGVSCLGKTSFVTAANAQGLKLDYAERSSAHRFFREKDRSHVIQILYTATFGLELLRRVDRLNHLRLMGGAETTQDPETPADSTLYVDRSPISDVWYELLFKHHDDQPYHEQVFRYIEELRVFDYMPTIFVVPDPRHAEAICRKMRERANGIDRMDPDYVMRQIRTFDRVVERFGEHPNVRVVRIDAAIEIFSPEYFVWIGEQFRNLE